MSALAEVDTEFAKLWRKVEARRTVIRSYLYGDGKRVPESVVLEECQKDRHYLQYYEAAEKRYARYLEMCEIHKAMEKEWGELQEQLEQQDGSS